MSSGIYFMDIQELLNLYTSHSGITALHKLIQNDNERNISVKGLNGSAPAMMVAALFKKGNNRFVCLLNDLEEAGYFYNDLKQLTGDDAIYFSHRPTEGILNTDISTQPMRFCAQKH